MGASPLQYCFAGGMSVSHRILEDLCEVGYPPLYAFGYPPELSHRSNYQSLDDLAHKWGFPLFNTKDINSPHLIGILEELRPDWFLVMGWSQLVQDSSLALQKKGTLGFHMSRLPEGRGRAPVAWTLIKGLDEGWATLQWLKPGVDDGDIALQDKIPVTPFDDAETLVAKFNDLAAKMMLEAVPRMLDGSLPRIPQEEAQATHWPKRSPDDGKINWSQSLKSLYDFIRGITYPFPGAFTYLKGELDPIYLLNVGRIEGISTGEPAGTILGPYTAPGVAPDAGMAVAVSDGVLIVRKMQLTGHQPEVSESLLNRAEQWRGRQFVSLEN